MKTVQEFLAHKELELASAARELEVLRIVAPLLRDEEDRVDATRTKILLVEGNDETSNAMRKSLENENCEVVSSKTVAEGLSQILAQQRFDVLITNLHTRRVGDNSTLVAALRTFQPACLLVAVSDSLKLEQAATAISLQADVIVRPSNIKQVAELLNAKTLTLKSLPSSDIDQWVVKNSRRIA
jgi:DNA-binding NtrC family response regulator